ncbi:MAG: hypothetical protein ABR964_11890 [Tepidisphaeraceae bacterium]
MFQRLVRQWETLHPYNGAQAIKIRGTVDLALCRRAWHDALAALGLGRVHLVGSGYRYECLNGDSIHHTVTLCPPGTGVQQRIADEMNRPFDAAEAFPFRPFVIQEGDGWWMGMGYQHWVADSVSIRLLMREWFARQFDPPAASRRPLRIDSSGYLRLFGPHVTPWRMGDALLAAMRWQSHLRRVKRIEDKKRFGQFAVGFVMGELDDALIDRLHATAQAAGAKVNDLFLAAIAETAHRHVPTRPRNGRCDLAVGNIVDLRARTHTAVDDVFGLLLGFTSVVCRPENLRDWDSLLGAIARQTRGQKISGAAEASWIRMLGGLAAGNLLSPRQVVNLYRKRVALAGACSNVNLNRCWPWRYHPDPLMCYVRAAPTGPMTPLVFTPTTLGRALSFGLTYRKAIFDADAADALAATFADRLRRLGLAAGVSAI